MVGYAMFEWWVEQPPYLRTTLALIPLGLGVLALFFGLCWVGISLIASGLVLFIFSFPSHGETRGYHDF